MDACRTQGGDSRLRGNDVGGCGNDVGGRGYGGHECGYDEGKCGNDVGGGMSAGMTAGGFMVWGQSMPRSRMESKGRVRFTRSGRYGRVDAYTSSLCEQATAGDREQSSSSPYSLSGRHLSRHPRTRLGEHRSDSDRPAVRQGRAHSREPPEGWGQRRVQGCLAVWRALARGYRCGAA